MTGLSATLEYRFIGLSGAASAFNRGLPGQPATTDKFYINLNQSTLIGLRYAFDAAPGVAPTAVEPAAPPQPAVAVRSYLVFFDWDRADLTARARQIVAEAAAASTRVQTTRIEVQGNADRSGTPAYNQGLSLRRAQAVAAELVTHGVAKTAIDIEAFDDTRPLVATAAGVREPQNRRVAIIPK